MRRVWDFSMLDAAGANPTAEPRPRRGQFRENTHKKGGRGNVIDIGGSVIIVQERCCSIRKEVALMFVFLFHSTHVTN